MLRIGIVGSGRIAHRFITECTAVSGLTVTAVYNPNISSAVSFVEKYAGTDLSRECIATDNLDIFSENVDAAYIAAPHEMHVIYAKALLLSGKHVLCEKPMAFTARDAVELYEIAKNQNLILMEAVKTACCPGFLGILDLLSQGVIGPVRDVEACFTKIGTAAGREMLGEYAGSFYELGSYSLLPIVKILGTDNLESYIWTLDGSTGADSYAKCVISYETGVATAKTGLGVKSEGELIIAGQTGYIRVPSPWWLTSKAEVHHEDPNQVEIYEYPFDGAGLRYEIDLFAHKVLVLGEMIAKYGTQANIIEPVWEEIANTDGITPIESIWMASQMENFGVYVDARRAQGHGKRLGIAKEDVRIWAHRGCSMIFPENTLCAFKAASEIEGITGIELDTQLTKDGEVVVIHDEKLDRTTTLSGSVSDYALSEIKAGKITGSGDDKACYLCNGKIVESAESVDAVPVRVPTLREVFEVLKPYCVSNGLLINIELKNSIVPYEGMEEKVIGIVAEYGLEEYIIYSSFNHASMSLVKKLSPSAKTGALSVNVSDCVDGIQRYGIEAAHPGRAGMDINVSTVRKLTDNKIPVRMWNTDEPFYGQSRALSSMDLREYAAFGATDIITNVPERYLINSF